MTTAQDTALTALDAAKAAVVAAFADDSTTSAAALALKDQQLAALNDQIAQLVATGNADDDTIAALRAQVAQLEAEIAAGNGPTLAGAPPAGQILVGSSFGTHVVADAQSRMNTYATVTTKKPGAHRSYYQATEIDLAITCAKWDISQGMLPWVSFKLPDTWAAMASGSQDAWFNTLNSKLASAKLPAIWITLHHEPENDQYQLDANGNQTTIQRAGYLPSDYLGMYVHGRPLIQKNLPGVEVGPIFMHGGVLGTSFGGQWTPAKLGFDTTNADFYGVDAYVNKMQNVQPDMGPTLTALAAVIKPTGLRPALGEFGYAATSYATGANPGSISRAVQQAVDAGFVVLSYFDSLKNSVRPWLLDGVRLTDFGVACNSPLAVHTVSAA